MKKFGTIVLQIALLYAISFASNYIAELTGCPIPGSIIGIVVLFGLLQFGVLRLEWFEQGTAFLHKELLLFFVPASVGIMQYAGVLYTSGAATIVTIAGSTVAVAAVTGIAAQVIARRKEGSVQ